jgi:hypothetical protein
MVILLSTAAMVPLYCTPYMEKCWFISEPETPVRSVHLLVSKLERGWRDLPASIACLGG